MLTFILSNYRDKMITKQFIGKNLIELKSIDSTNNYLSNFANKSKLLNGTVILAHNQTKGKGQRGNNWESEEGKNLTFSVFLKTSCLSVDKNFFLSIAVCNAIHVIVSKRIGDTKIKWPNDILVGNKKICGILIENSIVGDKLGNSIIGIGLNVNQENFEDNSMATSLKLETNTENSKSEILNQILASLEEQIGLIQLNKIEQRKKYYFDNLLGYKNDLQYINIKSN
ncbi:MAG: biotin--[acetyl-CoA-carboxylase] ligase, partial [Flavobacteriales bacterium]